MVATIWYLALTSAVSVVQYYIERWTTRGSARALPPTPLQRVRAAVRQVRSDRPGGTGRVAQVASAQRVVASGTRSGAGAGAGTVEVVS